MKYNKQAKKALLVMLAAFSILPGCGKKNDAGVAVGAVGAVQNIGSGQCANVSYNTATSITFYGQLQQGSGLMGDLSAYGYGGGGFAGSNYYRNLTQTGDALNVYVNGSTAYATLSIAANTASAIVYGQNNGGYGGTAQVCGIEINESIFANPISGNGFSGTLAGGYVKLWGNGNWITYGPSYGYAPILF